VDRKAITWAPLRELQDYCATSPSSQVFIAKIKKDASSLRILHFAREIIEMCIAIKCRDDRCAWLLHGRELLLSYASEPAEQLLQAYTAINTELARLGADQWIDVRPLLDNE